MEKKRSMRFLALAASAVLALCGMTACGGENNGDAGNGGNNTENKSEEEAATTTTEATTMPVAEVKSPTADVKIGLICLHDESSTYDLNFINSLETAKKDLKLTDDQIIIKRNIPEGTECKDAASELAQSGCNIVFADSFGHESFMLEAAKEFPDVHFCHATGTLAHTEKLPNYHNAFAAIYEGRYLTGVAAGMKLKEMIDFGKITPDKAVMGYVGAFTYAEVISGYTAFYLGAKSVCPSVTMKVQFTGSWYDEAEEKKAAENLINEGCVLISQHADSMGAPSACEAAGIPNVSYNGSTMEACPNTYIVSSRIDWAPYYEYMINSYIHGDNIEYDWVGNVYTNSIQMNAVNTEIAASDTKDTLESIREQLKEGSLHVFDTAKFTVDGKKLDSYMADVDTDPDFTPDTEVIKDGYFHESEFRSAPYFDIRIDGITTLNEKS